MGVAKYKFFHIPLKYFSLGGSAFGLPRNGILNVLCFKEQTPISINMEDGLPLFNMELNDVRGDVCFKMVNNTITLATKTFDFNVSGKSIIARLGPQKRLVDMKIDAGVLKVRSIRIGSSGFAIRVREDKIIISTNPLGGQAIFDSCAFGGDIQNCIAGTGVLGNTAFSLGCERGEYGNVEALRAAFRL
ncbi:hypothetical protein [Roseovarius sp. 217]|uniref:hypothetical protein n=1 Tax=Roseovarius sp. (strain 217) TaxID=314264 RepID=UPI0012EDA04A|nr:hypothetical protein [Roseovarius sp. 217]